MLCNISIISNPDLSQRKNFRICFILKHFVLTFSFLFKDIYNKSYFEDFFLPSEKKSSYLYDIYNNSVMLMGSMHLSLCDIMTKL